MRDLGPNPQFWPQPWATRYLEIVAELAAAGELTEEQIEAAARKRTDSERFQLWLNQRRASFVRPPRHTRTYSQMTEKD